jgi:hypothetical protein
VKLGELQRTSDKKTKNVKNARNAMACELDGPEKVDVEDKEKVVSRFLTQLDHLRLRPCRGRKKLGRQKARVNALFLLPHRRLFVQLKQVEVADNPLASSRALSDELKVAVFSRE